MITKILSDFSMYIYFKHTDIQNYILEILSKIEMLKYNIFIENNQFYTSSFS